MFHVPLMTWTTKAFVTMWIVCHNTCTYSLSLICYIFRWKIEPKMTFKYTMDKLLLNLRYHLTDAILQKFSTPFQNNNLKGNKAIGESKSVTSGCTQAVVFGCV